MLNATSIQQMLRRVDKGYQAFYKGKRGLPRLKGKHRFKSVEYRPSDGCKLKAVPRAATFRMSAISKCVCTGHFLSAPL